MNIRNQNKFKKEIKSEFQNPVVQNTVSQLKALSTDPAQKNRVLSTLARFQGQMNENDYNEILANVKSVKVNRYQEPVSEFENVNYHEKISKMRQIGKD